MQPSSTNANPIPSQSSSLEQALERINRLAAQNNLASPQAPPHAKIQETLRPRSDSPTSKLFKITPDPNEPIIPNAPESLEQAGLNGSIVEEIVMRFLLNRGEAHGRAVAEQIRLPFHLVEPTLTKLKAQQLSCYLGSTAANDYIHALTDAGRDRARRHMQKTTYFGSAPVPLEMYVESVRLQSVEHQHPTRDDLRKAFSDLLIAPQLLSRLGPAVNSGRGMFLFGFPGNGKTSIAERITKAFGEFMWIPRSVSVDGDLLRVYDPLNHEEKPLQKSDGLLRESRVDERWVRIRRPTIVAGGELTMNMLEVSRNPETNISDSPLQMKSNCGLLLIDDFGRQRMSVDELLNRWIVPLEKRYDFLSLSSGKKVQVPFDQLVVFSTNLEPKDLVDDAFLRRIPYKIEVLNPEEPAFRKLFEIMCKSLQIPYKAEIIDYLIEKHYKGINRPMRNCHPRDLLLQVRSYCHFNSAPVELTKEHIDFAVENYFSIM
ncbi:MAG: AAA family ATPase [Pirellula sp.]